MKLRIDPAIQIHFDLDEETGQRALMVEHLRRSTRFELLTAEALLALNEARDWVAPEAYLERLVKLGLTAARAQQFLADALDCGLIQQSSAAEESRESARAARWHTNNSYFAYRLLLAKANQVYMDYESPETSALEEALMSAYRDESPPPDIYKEYEAGGLIVPCATETSLLGGLDQSLKPPRQRSLTAKWLSLLLQNAFGETGCFEDPVQGKLLIKTHPSGGARHPVECYVVCRAVEGLSPGLYHYSVKRNALETVPTAKAADAVSLNLFPAPSPPLIIIFTVLPERAMWRYREPTSFCVLMLDLGHAIENFVMACECECMAYRLNLEPDPEQLAESLGVHAFTELPLAAMAIGQQEGGTCE